VPRGCLGRANYLSNAYGRQSTEGARQLNDNSKLISSTRGEFFAYIAKDFLNSLCKKDFLYVIIKKTIYRRGLVCGLSSSISCLASSNIY
jgi:hypothetical protein